MAKLMNIGFGNLVNTDCILCILSPDSAPAKRMVIKGKEQGIVIDATQGRRTKSLIITKEDKLILSALQPEKLSGRFLDTPQSKVMSNQSLAKLEEQV